MNLSITCSKETRLNLHNMKICYMMSEHLFTGICRDLSGDLFQVIKAKDYHILLWVILSQAF